MRVIRFLQNSWEAWTELGEACSELQMAILDSLHIPEIVDWLARRIEGIKK